MGNFRMQIDVEPDDIPSLDDVHKHDCADAINRAINATFKYTMIVSIAIIAFFAAYTLFGLVYVLRMGRVLPTLSPLIPFFALLIIISELIAGTMKRWALCAEIILHVILATFSLSGFQSMIAAPFLLYGAYLHLKLWTLIPHYEVISNLKGYPDFTSLPIGEVAKKKDTAEDPSEDKENIPEEEKEKSTGTEAVHKKETKQEELSEKEAPAVTKEEVGKPEEKSSADAEKEAPEEEKTVPEKNSEGKETDSPAEEKVSPTSANNQSPKPNSSSRKKKKKRKKSSK